MTVDPGRFRHVLGSFLTSVTLVSCRAGEEDHVATVSSFSVASFAAARVSISLGNRSRLAAMIRRTGAWGVSLLGGDGAELARFFASRGRTHGAGLDRAAFSRGPHTGAVLFDVALATLECRNLAELDGGSHVIFLAEPLSMSPPPAAGSPEGAGAPLCHFRGALFQPVLDRVPERLQAAAVRGWPPGAARPARSARSARSAQSARSTQSARSDFHHPECPDDEDDLL